MLYTEVPEETSGDLAIDLELLTFGGGGGSRGGGTWDKATGMEYLGQWSLQAR
jgi:hypothetical protein